MRKFSLRSRIFLSYFVLVALAIVAINWIAVRQIEEATEEVYREGFSEKLAVIHGTIEDYLFNLGELEENRASEAEFEAEEQALFVDLIEVAEDLDVAIRLLDLDGRYVIYDTEEQAGDFPTNLAEDVFQLVEFEEPFEDLVPETEEMVGTDYIYIEDEPVVIVRVSEGLSNLEASSRTQIVALVGATLVIGLVLILGLGGWLANAITQPLTQLRRTAQAMAAGKLDTRADTNAPQEVHLLADDFNQMATAVEQMMAEQRAFASNAAHELRTPLTAMRLRTETLLEDNPDEVLQARYISEIHNEVERLGRLVDDLRILSRVDAHLLHVGSEQIDLAHLWVSLHREFSSNLTEKNLSFHMDLSDPPYVVQASTNHIRTVLRNILENAIKYTPEGGEITVQIDKTPEHIRIQVQDTGVGIAAEDLPQLFNRFFRADKAHSRAVSGSGLGLSLVQSIVSLYGGQVIIRSDGSHRGTTAVVTWPQLSPNMSEG